MPGNPSPSVSTVRVFGTYKKLDGSPESGKVTFKVSQRVVSITDDVIFPAGTNWEVQLDANGSLEVYLPAVDDPDISPNLGWSIAVTEKLNGATGASYSIRPTLSMVGSGLDLVSVVLPTTPDVANGAIIRGVPGGIANLDSDGDPVTSSGSKVGTISLDIAEDFSASPQTLIASTPVYIPGCVISVPPSDRFVEIQCYVPFQVTAAGAGALLAAVYEITPGTVGAPLLIDGAGPVGSLLVGTWTQFLEGYKTIKLGPQTTERQFALGALLVRDAGSVLAAKTRSSAGGNPRAWIEAVAK